MSSRVNDSKALADVLDKIEAYLEAREDVRDGSDGKQLPNEEMSLLAELAEARTRWARANLSDGPRETASRDEKRWATLCLLNPMDIATVVCGAQTGVDLQQGLEELADAFLAKVDSLRATSGGG